jgi:phage host-nuclease inhibitor protein Gam
MPDIDLSEFLTDSIPEEGEIPRPDNDHEATVLLRRIGQIRKAIEEAKALAEAETSKVKDWERTVNAPRERQLQFFESLLASYMAHVRITSGDKIKSLNLPTGVVKTTAAQPKWEVADVQAFLAWAEQQERASDFYEEVKKPATLGTLKKLLQNDGDGNIIDPSSGELVPGVSLTPPETPFTITINPAN